MKSPKRTSSAPTSNGDSEATTRAVCDAGPIIHLDELGCLDLLDFDEIRIPTRVAAEVGLHRPNLELASLRMRILSMPHRTDIPSKQVSRLYGLSRADEDALRLAAAWPHSYLLTDDLALRRIASEIYELEAHGTLGLLLRGFRRQRRSKMETRRLLESIPEASSLHVRRDLLDTVLASF